MENIKKELVIQIEKYIKAILETYGEYIPKEKIAFLSNADYNNLIRIHNTNTINGFVNNDIIHFPLCVDKIFKTISKVPGYGINKEHKTFSENTPIDNKNNFLDYFIHVFISGTDAKGYYEDLLLHETMHLCGSDGGIAIREGLTELLTRKIAKKYGFRTNGCGYHKEVAIVLELESILGEEAINKIAFMKLYEIMAYLENTFGKDIKELFDNVMDAMNDEFYTKYVSHIDAFDGLTGIFKKIHYYNKIDYSEAYRLIDQYKQKNKTR